MTSSSSSLVDASNNGGRKLYLSPKRLHDELTRGREMTDQLRVMLCEITGGEGGSPPSSPVVAAAELLAAQGLAGKIVDTFTQSILMLDEEGSRTAPVVDSSPARNSEDSGESGKTPVQKDRRGCYKRRRSQKTYTKDTPGLFDDGHAWRKYGQKRILDSKHPRNYYRCTHKYDQNCQAKKHVQQIQENPTLYRTTYDGQHTCKKNLATSRSSPLHHQLFTTTSSITHDRHEPSSLLWNFQLQPNNYNFTVSIRDKSEINKTPSPSDYNNNDTKYSAVDGGYYMSPGHLKVFDQSDHNQHLCDRGDVISNVSEVYSCTESTHDSMHQQMHDMLSGVDSAFDDFLMD